MDEGLPVAGAAAGVAGGGAYEDAKPIAWCPPSGSDDGQVRRYPIAPPCHALRLALWLGLRPVFVAPITGVFLRILHPSPGLVSPLR